MIIITSMFIDILYYSRKILLRMRADNIQFTSYVAIHGHRRYIFIYLIHILFGTLTFYNIG